MGVLMEFYAGDAGKIADAFQSDPEFDLGSADFVHGSADFSLHIAPDTLDEMVAAACEAKKAKRFSWEEAQTEALGESVAKMSPAFVELFSSLKTEELVNAARPWMGDILTPDMEKAMGELIALCHRAKKNTSTWSLPRPHRLNFEKSECLAAAKRLRSTELALVRSTIRFGMSAHSEVKRESQAETPSQRDTPRQIDGRPSAACRGWARHASRHPCESCQSLAPRAGSNATSEETLHDG